MFSSQLCCNNFKCVCACVCVCVCCVLFFASQPADIACDIARFVWFSSIMPRLSIFLRIHPHSTHTSTTRRCTKNDPTCCSVFAKHKLLHSRYPSGNVQKWYSDAAMAQLGTVEVAALFSDIARNATPWISTLIDTVFMPRGGPVSVLLGGANWSSVCDRNGVPPAVIIAANRTSHPGDMAAVKVIAEQAMEYPHEGRCEGLMQLPTGVIARSSGGSWHFPPTPPLNHTQVRHTTISKLTSNSSIRDSCE